jgi:hypothetical protein
MFGLVQKDVQPSNSGTRGVVTCGKLVCDTAVITNLNSPPTIKLYYRLDVSPTDPGVNTSSTTFPTDPVADTYRGITNRYMVEQNFVTYNTNILSFVGYRTPKNIDLDTYLQVPDLYNETININVEPYINNYIQASANYVDSGSSFVTTVPFIDYTVSAASGIFNGCKNIRINFYNDGNPPGYTGLGKVRIVTIT